MQKTIRHKAIEIVGYYVIFCGGPLILTFAIYGAFRFLQWAFFTTEAFCVRTFG